MPGFRGRRECLLRSMRKMLAAVSRVLAGAAQKPVRSPDPGRPGWGRKRASRAPPIWSARLGAGDELRSLGGLSPQYVSPLARGRAV